MDRILPQKSSSQPCTTLMQPCRIRCPAITPVVFKSCGGTNNFCERSIASRLRILYSLRNACIGSIEGCRRAEQTAATIAVAASTATTVRRQPD